MPRGETWRTMPPLIAEERETAGRRRLSARRTAAGLLLLLLQPGLSALWRRRGRPATAVSTAAVLAAIAGVIAGGGGADARRCACCCCCDWRRTPPPRMPRGVERGARRRARVGARAHGATADRDPAHGDAHNAGGLRQMLGSQDIAATAARGARHRAKMAALRRQRGLRRWRRGAGAGGGGGGGRRRRDGGGARWGGEATLMSGATAVEASLEKLPCRTRARRPSPSVSCLVGDDDGKKRIRHQRRSR